MKHFIGHWYFYFGLGLFQSPHCRYLRRTLLFLCLMQLHWFDDNCFHWTQIRFLSLRIRPSILWVGPGYNLLYWVLLFPSVRAHNFLSLNLQQLLLFAADIFLFAAIIFYLQQLLFICGNFICFAATFLFAACPLWATVLNRGKRKSFHGKLHKL